MCNSLVAGWMWCVGNCSSEHLAMTNGSFFLGHGVGVPEHREMLSRYILVSSAAIA